MWDLKQIVMNVTISTHNDHNDTFLLEPSECEFAGNWEDTELQPLIKMTPLQAELTEGSVMVQDDLRAGETEGGSSFGNVTRW